MHELYRNFYENVLFLLFYSQSGTIWTNLSETEKLSSADDDEEEQEEENEEHILFWIEISFYEKRKSQFFLPYIFSIFLLRSSIIFLQIFLVINNPICYTNTNV